MFVIFFLMPVSVTYDLFFYVRNMIVFKLSSAPDKHDEKVKFVQSQASTHFTKLFCSVFTSSCIQNLELSWLTAL